MVQDFFKFEFLEFEFQFFNGFLNSLENYLKECIFIISKDNRLPHSYKNLS